MHTGLSICVERESKCTYIHVCHIDMYVGLGAWEQLTD